MGLLPPLSGSAGSSRLLAVLLLMLLPLTLLHLPALRPPHPTSPPRCPRQDTDDVDFLLSMSMSEFGNCIMQLLATIIFIAVVQVWRARGRPTEGAGEAHREQQGGQGRGWQDCGWPPPPPQRGAPHLVTAPLPCAPALPCSPGSWWAWARWPSSTTSCRSTTGGQGGRLAFAVHSTAASRACLGRHPSVTTCHTSSPPHCGPAGGPTSSCSAWTR